MTDIDRTWLYFKLYPTSVELLDRVVVDVLAPLVERRQREISRWFFLRFIDGAGAHIRLRMLMSLADADAATAECDRLAAQLMSLRTIGTNREALAESVYFTTVSRERLRPEVRLDVYEPELAKWGGRAYLPVAEAVFQTSSRCALMLIPHLRGAVVRRVALGVLVINDVLRALALGAVERRSFLETHYQWWSGANSGSERSHDSELRAAVERMLAPVLSEVVALADSAVVRDVIGSFTGALRGALTDSNPRQKPLFLVFHQLHLMLNRLGVAPYEEALVSLIAQSSDGAYYRADNGLTEVALAAGR